ncbi:hypothetical protein KC644_00130 [Candidatus Berkelbacteria bacterium]|nr:hypothetical protein [Candidatus Berkelbacteria bacterium]
MADSGAKAGGSDVEDNKFMAALSYFGLLVLIPLLTKKDSPYVKFHIKQGLGLLILMVAVNVILVIPFLGWIVGFIGWLAVLGLFIMGVINAFGGKTKPLPLIGDWADKNLNI